MISFSLEFAFFLLVFFPQEESLGSGGMSTAKVGAGRQMGKKKSQMKRPSWLVLIVKTSRREVFNTIGSDGEIQCGKEMSVVFFKPSCQHSDQNNMTIFMRLVFLGRCRKSN